MNTDNIIIYLNAVEYIAIKATAVIAVIILCILIIKNEIKKFKS